MDSEEISPKIFMLPWLAHGHISPYLELAKNLAHRNFLVYFCSTPVNLDAIKPQISHNLSAASIQFVEIDLESTPELPPHYHTAKGLPRHLMAALMKAFAMAAPKLRSILENLNPDLLIADILQPWILPLASSLNIPFIFFTIFSAASLSFSINRTLPNSITFPQFKLHHCWKSKVPDLYSDQNQSQLSFSYLVESSEILIIKTSSKIEAKYLDFVASSLNTKVVATGPLAQQPPPQGPKPDVIEWLDKKAPFSTVYVAFGSEYYPTKEEMDEIANGLERSEVNFILVVRFPMGEETNVEEALPEGFIERVSERGRVIEGWAPQAEILAHSSIGGHLSHCGWSSLMECMILGVPVICVPMHLDQPIYARLMEEIGMGLEVKRDEQGRITGDEVMAAIKKVVMENSGEGFRRKAEEISKSLRMGGEKEMDELAAELVRICGMKRVLNLT